MVVDDKVAGAVDDQEKVADFDDLRYPSGLSTFIIDFDRVAEDEVIGVRDKFDALADKKHNNHDDECSCQDDFFLFKTVSRVAIHFISITSLRVIGIVNDSLDVVPNLPIESNWNANIIRVMEWFGKRIRKHLDLLMMQ